MFQKRKSRLKSLGETADIFHRFAYVRRDRDGTADHLIEFFKHFFNFRKYLKNLPANKDHNDSQDGDHGEKEDLGRLEHVFILQGSM